MAKRNKPKKNISNTPVTDRSWWWSDLIVVDPAKKLSPVYIAQTLFFAKMNSDVLVDPKKAYSYRKNNALDIDEGLYRQMIDPKTPMGGGGNAEYFASDFKPLPIGTHLRNIRKAKLDKIGLINKPQVNEINKFSKSQRQKEKDKIIHQQAFRQVISEVAKELGLPPISRNESPEEYISKLEKKETKGALDETSRMMEQIKLQVKNNQDYALYERYVYKGEIERAFEMGIDYYIINQNKWANRAQLFNDDLVNFNRASGMWYTDNTTGRPVVKYLDPARLYTSPFREKDGEDIMYWFYEEPMPFQDFVRQFGDTLTDQQLKQVFLLNKASGTGHNLDWDCGTQRRNNAFIMVGKFCFLSQDSNDFKEIEANNGNVLWTPADATMTPDPESAEQKKKIYNVWYECYYIPPPGEYLQRNMQADWVWQSQYVFQIQKCTDMFRFGVDRRYAKSPLVIWKDESPSCTDIEESILPKIYTTWHKFQNCLVQDTQAVVIDEDFVLGVLNAVDEANPINSNAPSNPTGSNGINAGLETFRQMRQGGVALMKFRDKNGNVIPNLRPQEFFVNVDSGHMEKAEKYLASIIQQYELLKVMLAQSDVTEGIGAKPRVNELSIEASVEASNNAIWFVEYPVRQFMVMYSERCIQYILNLVKDKKVYDYEERWNNFEEVVGLAQSLMIEGVADIAPEDIGITVSLEDTTAQQDFVRQLALDMQKNNQLSYEGMMLALETVKTNYKYAYCLIGLFASQKAEENAAQAEVLHQQKMEELQLQRDIAMALQVAKGQTVDQNIMTQGNVDGQLQQQLNDIKYQSQSALKNQTTQGRIVENKEKLKDEADIEQQKSLI